MGRRSLKIDKPLVLIIALLVGVGLVIFASALFGPLSRGATHVSSVAFNHLTFGIALGLVALIFALFVDYRMWRRFAPHLFVLALIATALVFVDGLGFEHGGGRRWIELFEFTFQPSEALKIGAIFAVAAYFAAIKEKIADIRFGPGGYLALIALPAALLILQPDVGTLGIIILSTGAMYFAAGARWRDILLMVVLGILALGTLAMVKEHVRDRITTFLNPSGAPQAEGWQVKQSIIAIGSGGIAGRGFGQSVQKFTYLPEPMGDSIFAIAGEEFGFVGAITLVGLYLALAIRGFAIGSRAADLFGALLAIGIASYLSIEAFINIAGMLGAFPLTGVPLTFISQGGSAMLVSLFAAGVLLNVSKFAKSK